MTIYAEGTWEKPADWTENLLRTVSVEFECIDHIYEENLKAGIIKDADRESAELLDYLRKTDGVIIRGTYAAAQDAYDYFQKTGIKVCCFAEDRCGGGRRLFGKPVMEIVEAMAEYNGAVFVDNNEKGSAWGMGETDYFDYMGYKRNRDYFLLKDYMEIEGDSLKSSLRGREIVLAGDILLCEKLAEYLEGQGIFPKSGWKYIRLPEEAPIKENTQLRNADIKELGQDTLCLIVVPEYFEGNRNKKIQERKERIKGYIREHGIVDYSDYFSYMTAFINIEKETKCKYQSDFLRPQRIAIGSIYSCCGNSLIRGLLDYHPSIMMIDYNHLNLELFWFCIRLSGRNIKEISSLFLELYDLEWEGIKLKDQDAFIEKMQQLLPEEKDTCTSQELFVIFHIAYMYMYDRNLSNASDKMIYWEPHYIVGDILEECREWMKAEEVPCDMIRVVRNLCMSNGSRLKGIFELGWSGVNSVCQIAIDDNCADRENCNNSGGMVIRFEDLKCKPKEELSRICDEWKIPWSDTLMHTTIHGAVSEYNNGNRQVKDFDLKPVYHTYEEYFSELDRLKILLICKVWQKKYDYPYIDASVFSKRELQEIFLKEFRFMERLNFDTKRTRDLFDIRFQEYVRKRLQKLRMICKSEQVGLL